MEQKTVFNVKKRRYGARGDGTTDDYTAFQYALDDMARLSDEANSRGAILYIPFGVYRLSRTLHITRQMVIQGESGAGWFSGSVLKFDRDIDGIVIHRTVRTGADLYTTVPAEPRCLPLGNGAWTVIRDLAITGDFKSVFSNAANPPVNEDDPLTAANNWMERIGHSPLVGNGVVLYGRAMIENCYIAGFRYDGVHVETTDYIANAVNYDPAQRRDTNANSFEIQNCRIDQCGRHGVFTAGPNSNAGRVIGVDSSSNAGWAFYERSHLGNTYVGCLAEANGHYASDIRSVAIVPNGDVWVGTRDGGAFRSVDGGTTWTAFNIGLQEQGLIPVIASLAIDVTPSQYFVYAATLGGVFRCFHSYPTTGRTEWTRYSRSLTNRNIFAIVTHDGTLYAGTDDGVFKSPASPNPDDDGAWVRVSNGLTNLATRALTMDMSAATLVLYVGTDGGGVFQSADGGATWTAVNNGLGNLSVRALAMSGGVLYAATAGGVFRTSDGGATWSSGIGMSNLDALSIAVTASPEVAYAGTNGGGVFKSLDGGATWSAVNAGLDNLLVRALGIASGTTTTLYAGTDGRGQYIYGKNPGGVYRSDDSAATWIHRKETFYGGSYKAAQPGVPQNVYVGCYSEADQPNGLELFSPSVVVGGTRGGGFSNITDAVILDSAGLRGAPVRSPIVHPVRHFTRSAAFGGTPNALEQVVLNISEDRVLVVDASAGNVLVILPIPMPQIAGYQYTVKRLDLNPQGYIVQVINGARIPIEGQEPFLDDRSSITVVSDGAQYFIVARG